MGRQAALLWSGLGAFWVVAVPLSWALAFPAHLVQQLQHCAAFCRSGQLAQPSAPAPYSPLTVQLFCCRPFTTVMLQTLLQSGQPGWSLRTCSLPPASTCVAVMPCV